MRTHRRAFSGIPHELSAARSWARAVLDGHPCTEDAALIVTELGTNALLHTASGDSAGTFTIALTISVTTIAISVADCGGAKTTPQVHQAAQDDTHGRGLRMVTLLADHVEIFGDDSGHIITAELHVPSARQESTACL